MKPRNVGDAASRPPRFARWLLTQLHPDETLEEVEGDLDELYTYWYNRAGRTQATLRYLLNVVSVLPPFVRCRQRNQDSYEHPSILQSVMLRNYFKIALRTLSRNKLYTTLNVVGLAFGITCFLLIGLFLFDELTFDQQHSNADQIYRVVEHKNVKGEETTIAAASYKLAEESKKTIAEVENTIRVQRTGGANLINPENPVNFQETITIANKIFYRFSTFR